MEPVVQDIPPKFNSGTQVKHVRDGRLGVISKPIRCRHGVWDYQVYWFDSNGAVKTVEETALTSADDNPLNPAERMAAGEFQSYNSFLRTVTYGRLARAAKPRNELLAFNSSRSRFYAHQFIPVLKFLQSPRGRMIIADEVGLGKTIEAGLIIKELRARQDVRCVLIVCPSKLTEKWRMEMTRRFEEEFTIYDARGFANWLKDYEETPDKKRLAGVLALETGRRPAVIEALQTVNPDLDLVIVDEAHYFRNRGTETYKLAETLSARADNMLLLSATPVMLGQENLHSLLHLVDEQEFAEVSTTLQRLQANEPIVTTQNLFSRKPVDAVQALMNLDSISHSLIREHPAFPQVREKVRRMVENNLENNDEAIISVQRDLAMLNLIGHVFTRTRRREINLGATRNAFAWEVEFTPEEKAFYEAVTDFVISRAEQEQKSAPQAWLLHMPQRRAASSIPAMIDFYRKELNTGHSIDEEEGAEWDSDYDCKQTVEYSSDEYFQLCKVVSEWHSDRVDSKYEKLAAGLRAIRENEPLKVMIFSFFKATLAYLHKRLTDDGFGTVIMTGDTKLKDRLDIMQSFQHNPSVEILLASNVGSEGLDLQFSNTMVNYDLPWNPMELEQRIGRIDRIGQKSETINIYNLWIKGSIEERILKKLLDRIGIFRSSIGEIDDIVGQQFRDLERECFAHKLTPEQQELRVAERELALQKRRQTLDDIDNQAGHFLATEHFFQQEIKKIKDRHAYITPGQIRSFVDDFLHNHCPDARLQFDNSSGTGILRIDQSLATVLSQVPDGAQLGVRGSNLKITFDGEVANANPDLELITVIHPLVAAITKKYSQQRETIGEVHTLVLKTNVVSAGFWFYFIYDVVVKASLDMAYVELVLVSGDGDTVISGSKTRDLFALMLENGEDSPAGAPEVQEDIALAAWESAENAIALRKRELLNETDVTHTAYLRQLQDSAETGYKRKISQIEAKMRQVSDRMRRLFERQVITQTEKHKVVMAELETKSRPPTAEYVLWGCGVLEVLEVNDG